MPWIIFLCVVGVILICLEVVLPGVVMGIFGVLCLIAAVILTYVNYGAGIGNLALVALLIASAIALILWITLFPKT